MSELHKNYRSPLPVDPNRQCSDCRSYRVKKDHPVPSCSVDGTSWSVEPQGTCDSWEAA